MKKEGYLITGDDISSMGLTLLPGKEHLSGKYALTKDEIIDTYYANVSDISDNITCVTYEKVSPSVYLNLSKSSVDFLASGGSDSIELDTNASSDQIIINYTGNAFTYQLTDKTLNISAASLGTTEKSKVTETLTVSVGSLSKEVTISQEENRVVAYAIPTGRKLTVSDIPAAGGTISKGTLSGDITQEVTYTSGESKSLINPNVSSEYYSTAVTASSLGTTIKSRTSVGTLTYYYTCNGKKGATTVNVYQAANSITGYSVPTGRTLTVSDIPAKGGTVSSGTLGGTISQTRTYTSGSTDTVTNPTVAKSSYSTAVTASSLGTTVKIRTKIGTLTYSYTCNGKTGSVSASVYQQANEATNITYGSWVITVSSNKYTSSSVACPASGGSATITRSASRTRTQNYTSGATSPLSAETAMPTLSVSGAGFTLNGTTVTIANRTNVEGNQRTASVTATHSGVSKSISLYQQLNKLTSVTATGSASSYTVMNMSAVGGTVTWTPTVSYTSGWSGTPPSGVTITYSSSNTAATQSNNITTWSNRGTTIGSWRGSTITISAKSSYTTTPVTGSVSTGQNMNTVVSSKIIPMSGSASDVNFPASGASRGFVGEMTLSSGSKIQGADYRNYITFSLTSTFGTWTPNGEKYYGIVTVASRGTTIGAQKSGTLTHKISGTINGVSVNKSGTLSITQALNTITGITVVSGSGGSPTTSVTASGATVEIYPQFTFSSGSIDLNKSASQSGTWSGTATGFTVSVIEATYSYGRRIVAANRGTTIGAARSIVSTFTLNTTINGVAINKSVTHTLTQALNTITSLAIIPSAGAADTTSYPSGNFAASGGTKTPTKSERVVGTFSSGSQAYTGTSGAWYGGTLTLSRSWSMATASGFSMNTSNGIVTASNRGTTIGAARTCNPKCVISGSFTNPSSVGGTVVNAPSVTDSFTLTQALNKVVSVTETSNTLSYPNIAAAGGTSTPSSTATARFTYSSGSTGNPTGYTSSSSYSMTTGNGFSINTSSGVVAATNNMTASARTSNTITRTTVFSYTNPSSVGGGTVSETITKTATCTQSAGVKTYANPVVSLSYATIPAKGGTVSPTLSYSQTWGWNGATSGGGTINSGGTVSYSGTSVNTTNGSVTAASKGTTVSNITTVTTATVTVKLNGKTGTKSATVQQAANSRTAVYDAPTVTLKVSDIPASGGSVSSGTVSYSQKWRYSYTSGSVLEQTAKTSGGSVSYSTKVSASSLGTTIKSRTAIGTLTATVTMNGKSGSGSATVYQQANEATTISYGSWVVSVSANRYTTSSSPCPASGGSATITRSASRTRTQNYTSGSTSALSNETATPTLSISGTGFSLSGTTVTAANRTTTEGALRSAKVTATHSGVSKTVTVYQQANAKYREYSNLVGHIGSTSWGKTAHYTSFWATGNYTERYTSGSTGASGSGSIPWDNVTFDQTWCSWNEIQGAIIYEGNTGAARSVNITGNIGSWTYTVKATQAAGFTVGRLTLHIPVSVGYVSYWNITVRSTSGGVIWSGGVDTSLSTGLNLVMLEDCAMTVALDPGTVSFSTTYSTGTDRRYSGSISGTEQDRLKNGTNVTVYLS